MTDRLEELSTTMSRLQAWFTAEGRGFFERSDATRLPGLESLLSDAKGHLSQDHRELPICFLGNAGVGKSTLINSLVDPVAHVVPQGGVGPLTAQATVVRYAERPFLRAHYFGAKRLNQLTFALDRFSERRQRRAVAEDNVGLDVAAQNEVLFVLSTGDDASDEDRQVAESRARAYISQARLLVTGNQYGDDSDDEISYLADMLRAALGRKPLWGHESRPDDEANLLALRSTVALGDAGKFVVADEERSGFLLEVRRHATGSIAPLIKSLEVGWQSDVLRNGLTLVDLPGVGVANDEYRSVTSDWIRRASAVVLVVDRAGVTEASADLLRVTGFLNTLLHRAPDSTQVSPLLWVVAVKLDDVARDERISFKQQHPNDKLPRWLEFFQQSCGKAQTLIQNQLIQELEKTTASTPAEMRADRTAAQARVLEQLQVHAISAIEYRKLMAQDDDDRALVATEEESNLPKLADAMRSLARRHVDDITNSTSKVIDSLIASINRGALGVLENLEGTAQVQRLEEETRARLAAFIAPRERDLALRQGSLRERLRETIPATIEREVMRGVSVADKSVGEYLATLQKTHWSTLRATVRRGGVRIGRRTVDLPNELALRFEEPLALIWNRSVVNALKAALDGFAKDVHRTLEEVVKWAQSPEAKLDAKRVERYRDDIAANLARLSDLANTGAALLREQVKQRLHETMEATIRRECQRFVESGMDRGTGVSHRVIAFLKDAIGTATRAAAAKASKFLVDTYQQVVANVSTEFAQASNALTHAQSLLLGDRRASDVGRVEDAQRVRALISRVPALPTSEG